MKNFTIVYSIMLYINKITSSLRDFNKKLYSVSSNILLVVVVLYQIFYMFLYQNSLLLEAYPLQFNY